MAPQRRNTASATSEWTTYIHSRVYYILLCCFFLFATFVTCQDTKFAFAKFDPGSLTLVADSRIVNGKIRVVNVSLNAIDWNGVTAGRALYPQPVQLRDPSTTTIASFKTSFTFSIDTQPPSNFVPGQPSGIAWGIFPDNRTIGDVGRFLGLLNFSTDNYLSNKLFAIEVDSSASPFGRLGFNDPSSCHLGVDLLTMNSKPFFDMAVPPGNNLSTCIQNKGVYTLNLVYDGVSHVLLVDLLDVGSSNVGHINYTINLYPYMNDFMYVGFSSGGTYEQPVEVSVFSWSFFSTFGSLAAPAPGPATVASPGSPPTPGSGSPGVSPPSVQNCTTFCTSSNSTSISNNKLIYGAAAGGAGALLLLLGLCLGWFCMRRRASGAAGSFDQEAIPGGVAMVGPRRFTYKELSAATKSFSPAELLGQGGSGSVYKGVLRDSGAMVAVKVIQAERSREMAEKEFQAEVSIISQIRHRNLVQLQGWCNEKGVLCLVYEFLPNGSLDSLLRKEMHAPNTVLPWGTRFNILTGVAAALAYLHEEIGQCIVHRDLKPGNVLLDANYNACLADFGLARLIDHDAAAPTTMLAGTMGYMAPELPQTGRATKETDVYSFGILIIEMLCGRRPTDVDRETQMPLLDCVWAAHAGNDILCIVDPKIRDDRDAPDVERTLLLGLLCCHPDPICRPSMRTARQILPGDSPLPPVPTEKPVVKFSVYSQYGPYAELDFPDDDDPPLTGSSKASSKYSNSSTSNPNSRYSSTTNGEYTAGHTGRTENGTSFSAQSKSFL